MTSAIREIYDHDPFVHAESVAGNSPFAADLTVGCFVGKASRRRGCAEKDQKIRRAGCGFVRSVR
jgi:hypothetical protein